MRKSWKKGRRKEAAIAFICKAMAKAYFTVCKK
jgi:hypothetical protein